VGATTRRGRIWALWTGGHQLRSICTSRRWALCGAAGTPSTGRLTWRCSPGRRNDHGTARRRRP